MRTWREADTPCRLLIRDDARRVRIGEPAFHHDVKSKLAHDLLVRAVLRLLLDKAGEFFLRCGHG